MNNKKRFFVVIITLLFCISIFTVNTLAVTTQEKADVLNKLSILKGSGGNYNLDSGLKRCEAATFIIRLMGLENHVLDNKPLYMQTSYPDVDAGQWYAPYIGYCSINSIIGGSTDGKFHPDDNISEKSFLKLVLCALGYEYNKDFTWNEINSKAYSLGLVTDIAYAIKTDDNNKFTRGKAFDIGYNALKLVNQTTGREMFYNLIDNNVITREVALAAGILVDETATDIDEITSTDTSKLSVKFNENIKELTLSNIIVYETDDSSKQLVVQIDSQSEDEVILVTSGQKAGIDYTVMVLGVVDVNGNISGTLKGTFTGYMLDVENVESDFFRIQSIEPLNQKSIKISFTHPVNVNSELAKCYSIYSGGSIFSDGSFGEITVKTLSSANNEVILTINKGSFEQDVIYSLEVSGDLTSAYGVKLNDGSGDTMKFTASSEASEAFALTGIVPYDSETLLINFNKELNPFLVGQIYNFYLTDEDDNPIRIEKTAIESIGSKKGKALYVNIEDTFDKDATYYFTINNLNDATRQEYITEKTYKFDAAYGSGNKMKSDKVSVIDNQTLEISFTKPLDLTTVNDIGNYSLSGIGHSYYAAPEKIYYDPNTNPYKVKVYLPSNKKLIRNKDYQIRIDNSMKDYIGNLIYSNQTENFDGTSTEAGAPEIDTAVAISSDAVKITFDKEIALNAPNILTDNYSLEYYSDGIKYKKLPLSVIYINATNLVLKFDNLEYGVEYTIRYNTIKDYAGNESSGTDDENNNTEFMLIKESQ